MLGLALSLIVHALTVASIDVLARTPYVWCLHIGCLIPAIPFGIALKRQFGQQFTFSQLQSVLPRWAALLLIAMTIYAAINLVLFLVLSEGAFPDIRGGQFVLQRHGKIVRVLSEAEFHAQRAYQVRGISGCWLLLYLAPTLFFLVAVRPNVQVIDVALNK